MPFIQQRKHLAPQGRQREGQKTIGGGLFILLQITEPALEGLPARIVVQNGAGGFLVAPTNCKGEVEGVFIDAEGITKQVIHFFPVHFSVLQLQNFGLVASTAEQVAQLEQAGGELGGLLHIVREAVAVNLDSVHFFHFLSFSLCDFIIARVFLFVKRFFPYLEKILMLEPCS